MIIRWTQDAVQDLQALRHYIAQDNKTVAKIIAQKILKGVNHLAEHPEMGRAGRVNGTRELIVGGTPYLIPYRVKNNTVEILRVFHAAMQWPEEI